MWPFQVEYGSVVSYKQSCVMAKSWCKKDEQYVLPYPVSAPFFKWGLTQGNSSRAVVSGQLKTCELGLRGK